MESQLEIKGVAAKFTDVITSLNKFLLKMKNNTTKMNWFMHFYDRKKSYNYNFYMKSLKIKKPIWFNKTQLFVFFNYLGFHFFHFFHFFKKHCCMSLSEKQGTGCLRPLQVIIAVCAFFEKRSMILNKAQDKRKSNFIYFNIAVWALNF